MEKYFDFKKEDVLTWPNLISTVRLLLAPLFLILFLNGKDLAAFFAFGIAAATDWVDGRLARRTNTVSKLGKILDPLVDRVLIFVAVLGLLLVNRIPLWIVILLITRDILLVIGGVILGKTRDATIPVLFTGKATTASLSVGFCLMIINLPQVVGLGITNLTWLPGFTEASVSLGIWFIYLGIVLSVITFFRYLARFVSIMKTPKDI